MDFHSALYSKCLHVVVAYFVKSQLCIFCSDTKWKEHIFSAMAPSVTVTVKHGVLCFAMTTADGTGTPFSRRTAFLCPRCCRQGVVVIYSRQCGLHKMPPPCKICVRNFCANKSVIEPGEPSILCSLICTVYCRPWLECTDNKWFCTPNCNC